MENWGWVSSLLNSATILAAVLWLAPRLRKLLENETVRQAVVTALRWAEEEATKRQKAGQPVPGEVKLQAAIAKARELDPKALLSKSDSELAAYVEAQLPVERERMSRPPESMRVSIHPPATSLLTPMPPEMVEALKAPPLPSEGVPR